jgi:hypothetical protein
MISTAPEKYDRGGLALRCASGPRVLKVGGDPLELLDRVHGQAAIERFRHYGTVLQLVAEAGREDHPPFRVEGVLVLSQEHALPTT